MTGPEHYQEAERLLANAERTMKDAATERAFTDALELTVPAFAAAQVHATLALAAATAHDTAVEHDGRTAAAWRTAIIGPVTL